MERYHPEYEITPEITNLIYRIAQDLERINIVREQVLSPRLRRENRIKTIHSSLQIEANTLSLGQVADVIDGKAVIGPARDILEVKDAMAAYEKLPDYDPYSVQDLLSAHKLMTSSTVKESGRFRSGGVGVVVGDKPIHIAPQADLVPGEVAALLKWTKKTDLPQVLKSCIFHYEFEFIHPFADGNGRMGRMWQTLLLIQENPVFGSLPVETLIAARQHEYYQAIERSTRVNNSAIFAEFMLGLIAEAVAEFKDNQGVVGAPLPVMLSKNAEKVYAILAKDPAATYKEIAKALGVSEKTAQRSLTELKDAGIIARVGTDKAGQWEICKPLAQ